MVSYLFRELPTLRAVIPHPDTTTRPPRSSGPSLCWRRPQDPRSQEKLHHRGDTPPPTPKLHHRRAAEIPSIWNSGSHPPSPATTTTQQAGRPMLSPGLSCGPQSSLGSSTHAVAGDHQHSRPAAPRRPLIFLSTNLEFLCASLFFLRRSPMGAVGSAID